jgi:hypothetical protein
MKSRIYSAIAFSAMLFLGHGSMAQTVDVPGWDPLPDSLHTIWKLDPDQVKRLRMIEEDHETEKAALLANKAISTDQRDQQLRELANARRNEIKAVLQLKQFEDWQRRCRLVSK